MMAHCVAASPGATLSWRPSARPRRASGRHLRFAARSSAADRDWRAAEQELLAAVQSLGYPAAIFPGDEQARAGIDTAIAALEAASPTPSPLCQPEHGGEPAPELLGEWKLIYASNGTYVTRSAPAQALLAASRLPGVGVSDVRQSLQQPGGGPHGGSAAAAPAAASSSSGSSGSSSSSSSSGAQGIAGQEEQPQLLTSNAACFGLGPFGDWEVVLHGVWAIQSSSLARVSFDGFTLQLVGLQGLIKLPAMAKVSVPVRNSNSADFSTTYLSSSVRVARGRTQNIFLFSKLPS